MTHSRRHFLRQLLAGTAAGALSWQAWAAPYAAPPEPPQDQGDEWEKVRAQFRLDPGLAWLNTGTLGLMPDPVMAALQSAADKLRTGEYSIPLSVRETVAKYLNASTETIALTHNTTHGINIVAQGLPLKRNDEIIITDQEHVGNALPWLWRAKRDGLRLRILQPGPDTATTLERLAALVNGRTRVIALPHITCTTGHVLPIAAISAQYKDRIPYIFFDGAHGPGTSPLDLSSLDCGFYASCGHKWLCGPAGTGFLYIRPDLLQALQPQFVGAGSDTGWTLNQDTQSIEGWATTASRFETGTQGRILAEGLQAAITFFGTIGWDKIYTRIRDLNHHLHSRLQDLSFIEILTPQEPASSASILSFRAKASEHRQDLIKKIQDTHRFRIREVQESSLQAIRISTHLFNTPQELDQLADFIATCKP